MSRCNDTVVIGIHSCSSHISLLQHSFHCDRQADRQITVAYATLDVPSRVGALLPHIRPPSGTSAYLLSMHVAVCKYHDRFSSITRNERKMKNI